jgi:hypothetical protein
MFHCVLEIPKISKETPPIFKVEALLVTDKLQSSTSSASADARAGNLIDSSLSEGLMAIQ